MQDAFGVDRSDISKGFSPAQLEVMTRAGGSFAQRANAARAGQPNKYYKGTGRLAPKSQKSYGEAQRGYSTSQFPRGTQNKARSTGYRKEYVAPTQSQRGIAINQARANGQRAVLGRDSYGSLKLNSAKRAGRTFGANNPANRVSGPGKYSAASVKSRIRAKFGKTSY